MLSLQREIFPSTPLLLRPFPRQLLKANTGMADPLSIAASALAVVTAAIQSTKSLVDTVKRFKDRDKTLRRLQAELEDLTNILDALAHVTSTEKSMLALLEDPLNRCSQICCEFERSMKVFSERSKIGFRDWAKLEFMRGDINDFIDTIAGYKSTISVGLGTITMLVAILYPALTLLMYFY